MILEEVYMSNQGMKQSSPSTNENPVVALLRDTIQTGQTVRIRAHGGSMRPLIPDGSVVELGPINRRLEVGDVVAARVGEHFVIHRVTSVGAMITLRGDLTHHEDRPVHPADIIALGRTITTPRGWTMRIDTAPARLAGRLLSRFVTHPTYPLMAHASSKRKRGIDFIDFSS